MSHMFNFTQIYENGFSNAVASIVKESKQHINGCKNMLSYQVTISTCYVGPTYFIEANQQITATCLFPKFLYNIIITSFLINMKKVKSVHSFLLLFFTFPSLNLTFVSAIDRKNNNVLNRILSGFIDIHQNNVI